MEASNNSIRNADGPDLSQKGIASLEESAGLSTERGEARTGNVEDQLGAHLLTPETPVTTHCFFANSRNYALDDPSADEAWITWQKVALSKEDSSMVESLQTSRL